MEKISISILRIPKWIGIILLIISAILLSIFIYSIIEWIRNKSTDYLTIMVSVAGVIINIGAMLALIITLWEQQKVNQESNYNRLEDHFYSKIDRFMSLLKEKSESSKSTGEFKENKGDKDLKCSDYLESKWAYEIREKIIELTERNKEGNLLKDSAQDNIEKIKLFSREEDLSRISLFLHDILISKNNLLRSNQNNNAIDVNWPSIPKIWKLIAGFFFTWNKIGLETPEIKELIELYLNEMGVINQPDMFPNITVTSTEDLQTAGFNKQTLYIQSKGSNEVKITGVKLFEDVNDIIATNEVDILLLSSNNESSNGYSLEKLFGEKISDKIFKVLDGKEKNRTKENVDKDFKAILDIHLKHCGHKWIFRKEIEFTSYIDHKTSIICKNK